MDAAEGPRGDDVPAVSPAASAGPLAIVCGGGAIPLMVAASVVARGRQVFLLAIDGWADTAGVMAFPHAWMKLGAFGKAMRMAREAGCREVVCVGALQRPSLRAMKLDLLTLRLLPRLYALYRGGDNHLLAGVRQLLEAQGFIVRGAHEVAPEIVMASGVLSQRQPQARDFSDAERGFALIAAIGPFDVGQAVIVAGNHVLAVEAAEGTDAMLSRVAELRRNGRIRSSEGLGVLVKAPKPGQELRMDMPTIGPTTITGVRAAGLAGIVVQAGTVLVAEYETTIAAADRAGVFLAGAHAPPQPPA